MKIQSNLNECVQPTHSTDQKSMSVTGQAVEQNLQIPDRTYQLQQQQINLQVRSGEVIDANQGMLKTYVQPLPDHTRKICFFVINVFYLIFLLICLFSEQQSVSQQQFCPKMLKHLHQNFILNFFTVILNLIFYYSIKPHRIVKYADYFLLLNVHKRNVCLNIFIGYAISDFSIVIFPISIILLIANSIVVCYRNYKQKRIKKAVEEKDKLLSKSNGNLDQQAQLKVMQSEVAISRREPNSSE